MIKKLAIGFILFSILVVTHTSCDDNNLVTGIEVLPADELLSASADTVFDLMSFTHKRHSNSPTYFYKYSTVSNNKTQIRSNHTYFLFGALNDPIFGQTFPQMYFRPSAPGKKGYEQVSAPKLQSAKLYFRINEDLPKQNSSGVDLNLYKLKGPLNYGPEAKNNISSQKVSTNYLMPSEFYGNELVNTSNISSKSLDSAEVADLGKGDYLVVTLDNNIHENLLDSICVYDTIDKSLSISATFPGYYAYCDIVDDMGAMYEIQRQSPCLVLDYSQQIKEDTKVFDTNMTFKLPINHYQCFFKQTHNTPELDEIKETADSVQLDKIYLQSCEGVESFIKLPLVIWTDYLDKGINFAQLVLPVNEENIIDSLTYKLPDRLNLSLLTNGNETSSILDNAYQNGALDKTDMTYRFNMTEQINAYIRGKQIYNSEAYDTSFNEYPFIKISTTLSANPEINFESYRRVVADKPYIRIIYTETR